MALSGPYRMSQDLTDEDLDKYIREFSSPSATASPAATSRRGSLGARAAGSRDRSKSPAFMTLGTQVKLTNKLVQKSRKAKMKVLEDSILNDSDLQIVEDGSSGPGTPSNRFPQVGQATPTTPGTPGLDDLDALAQEISQLGPATPGRGVAHA